MNLATSKSPKKNPTHNPRKTIKSSFYTAVYMRIKRTRYNCLFVSVKGTDRWIL